MYQSLGKGLGEYLMQGVPVYRSWDKPETLMEDSKEFICDPVCESADEADLIQPNTSTRGRRVIRNRSEENLLEVEVVEASHRFYLLAIGEDL